MDGDALQIRSFRVVFDLERRIHRIDRFRVPLPYGLPLRSVGYAAGGLAAVLVLERVPVIGAALTALATPLRLVVVPVGVSVLLSRLRVDGRAAHAAAVAWLRFELSPTRYVAFRPLRAGEHAVFGDVTLARTPPQEVPTPGAVGVGEQLSFDPLGEQVSW